MQAEYGESSDESLKRGANVYYGYLFFAWHSIAPTL